MVKVKNIEEATRKYEASASNVRTSYENGIKATSNWKENATSDQAEQLYAEKLREAIANKSRQRGLERVSESEWKDRALSKGASSISGAMRDSKDKWRKNTQPYFDVIEGISLPARTSDPEQNVLNRVLPIVKALAEAKKNR